RTISSSVGEYIGRLRSGEPGALPSVLGLIVLLMVFSQVSAQFLTSYNICNLPSQGAYIAIIGLGLVFALLLGEIDLSAGTTGGRAAACAARAVFSGDLHHALPAGTYWGLIVGLLAAIGLAVWLRTYIGAVVVALGLIAVVTNLDKHVIIATYVAVAIGAA